MSVVNKTLITSYYVVFYRTSFCCLAKARTAKKYKKCPVIALLRAQSLILDETGRAAEASVEAVQVHIAGIEVEVPCLVGAIGRGRPEEAVGAHEVHVSKAKANARGGQNNGIAIRTCDFHAITYPIPLAQCFQF